MGAARPAAVPRIPFIFAVFQQATGEERGDRRPKLPRQSSAWRDKAASERPEGTSAEKRRTQGQGPTRAGKRSGKTQQRDTSREEGEGQMLERKRGGQTRRGKRRAEATKRLERSAPAPAPKATSTFRATAKGACRTDRISSSCTETPDSGKSESEATQKAPGDCCCAVCCLVASENLRGKGQAEGLVRRLKQKAQRDVGKSVQETNHEGSTGWAISLERPKRASIRCGYRGNTAALSKHLRIDR